MGHPDVHSLDIELHDLGTTPSHLAVVNIAAYRSYDRSDIAETVDYRDIADIARMPYLVASGEMDGIPVVPAGMGIAKNSYFHN